MMPTCQTVVPGFLVRDQTAVPGPGVQNSSLTLPVSNVPVTLAYLPAPLSWPSCFSYPWHIPFSCVCLPEHPEKLIHSTPSFMRPFSILHTQMWSSKALGYLSWPRCQHILPSVTAPRVLVLLPPSPRFPGLSAPQRGTPPPDLPASAQSTLTALRACWRDSLF